MALLSHFRSTQHPGDQRQHSQLYHDKVSQAIFSRACPWLASSPACCIQLLPSLLRTWPYFASLYIPLFFFSFFSCNFPVYFIRPFDVLPFFSRRLIFFCFKKWKIKNLWLNLSPSTILWVLVYFPSFFAFIHMRFVHHLGSGWPSLRPREQSLLRTFFHRGFLNKWCHWYA